MITCPCFFTLQSAKDLEVNYTYLIAPYLANMKQVKNFHTGEGIISNYLDLLISQFVETLVTIDPYLHQGSDNIANLVVVGLDSENKQWVPELVKNARPSFIVLEKIRHGDNP